MVTRKEVERVAKLARIGISKKEEEKFARELSLILDYVKKLKEVDISKTLPTSHSITRALAKSKNASRSFLPSSRKRDSVAGDEASASSTEIENVTREDEGSEKYEERSSKLLDLAPEIKGDYLKVKSIL